MFNKILVPVDGSAFMPALVDYSIDFAKQLGSELKFLYVLDMPKTALKMTFLNRNRLMRRFLRNVRSRHKERVSRQRRRSKSVDLERLSSTWPSLRNLI